MKAVSVGILGLGTVASGTVTVMQRNYREIVRRAGREIHIKKVAVRDLSKQRTCESGHFILSDDPFSLVRDPDIDIVIELIGGEDIALELVMAAIKNGKALVTANKALIAKHGNAIFAAARKEGCMVAFEAAVAAGIPVIKAIREGLAGNRIDKIIGIINGTSNFILTGMQNSGAIFEDMLREAQQLGYAEADPSYDIGGIDVAHKITILASIAFGIPLQFDKVHIEGIQGITQQDIRYAGELSYCLKHLGIAERTPEGIQLRVHPTLIPVDKTMAHVDGVMNALLVQADPVGQTMYYGPGAGAEATASAIVADLVDVVRTLTTDPTMRVPHLAFHDNVLDDVPLVSIDRLYTAYYLRMLVADKPGILAEITHILAEKEISIESILQKEQDKHAGFVPIIIITHRVIEKNMNAAILEMQKLEDMRDKITRIRLDHL